MNDAAVEAKPETPPRGKLRHLLCLCLLCLAGVGLFVLIYFVFFFPNPNESVRADSLVRAVNLYVAAEQGAGRPVPPFVFGAELVRRRYLDPSELKAFEGAEVMLATRITSNPSDVLAQVKFADGAVEYLMMDGSVQTKNN